LRPLVGVSAKALCFKRDAFYGKLNLRFTE
ncbi:MAG: hypothetical protein QOF44_1822, partial [Streptomyces sp.]|nr:hypothetical protein [Streptomyces sp.]